MGGIDWACSLVVLLTGCEVPRVSVSKEARMIPLVFCREECDMQVITSIDTFPANPKEERNKWPRGRAVWSSDG